MKFIEKLPLPCLRILAAITQRNPRVILSLRYFIWSHKWIDWTNPRTLQEYVFKLIADGAKNPIKLKALADMADKIKVREYVSRLAGEKYLPRLLGRWKRAEDINWDSLPQKFAIKTNNGCGTNIIVRDKSNLNIKDAENNLKRWLKFPYGQLSGQPQYSAIEPEILAEELLEIEGKPQALPPDYKFFCFNGQPKFILYYEGRSVNGHITLNSVYDLDWNLIDSIVRRPVGHAVPRPKSMDDMIVLAKKLSHGVEFVRVDMYDINGKAVFGEMTFTPDVYTNFTDTFLEDAVKEFAKAQQH